MNEIGIYGDLGKKIWCGHYDKDRWVEHREKKMKISVDKEG